MSQPLRVLILEDSEDDCELIIRALRLGGFEPRWERIESESDYLARLHLELDVILADFNMPQFDASRALQLLNELEMDVPFIIVSGSIGEDTAVKAMQQGADDYLLKDRLTRLGEAVRRAMQAKALRQEKQAAQAALRESEARFRRLAEHAPDIIYRFRVLPSPGFEYVSPAVTEITGYTPEELYANPQRLLEGIHPEGREAVQTAVESNELSKQPFVLRGSRKEGQTFWAEVRNTPVYDETGALAAIEGVARDITARVLQQQEEEQRQQHLQEQDRLATVGQLAAGIAHDFNNILGVITLYSEILLRNQKLVNSPKYLTTINAQAHHAAVLVRQILDFSRQGMMSVQLIDLLSLLNGVVELLERTLPENITVSLERDEGDFTVLADPTRVQQVVMNLAVNARDAMPDGGKLQIVLSHLQLPEGEKPPLPGMAAGPWIRLKVSDSGMGIAAETLPRIFEPFYTTKQKGEGTGLGLAQVYGIVKQHNGEIDVDSTIGVGSCFSIYLPGQQITQSSSRTLHKGDAAASAGRAVGAIRDHGRILVVEDDQHVRLAIQHTLEAYGYRIVTAGSGREALKQYERSLDGINLLLTDMVMPGIGGLELVQTLAGREPGLRILLMTGYMPEGEAKALLGHDNVAWLQKPFTGDELVMKVREMLGQG